MRIPKQAKINEAIRTPRVRLIDRDGNQVGVMETKEALRIAVESGLDLVEVASQADPPVCRIIDYGKYLYVQSKRAKEARKKHKTMDVKEMRIRPKIDEHDYQVKFHHLERFLAKGDKAKVTLIFRGRERAHADLARKLLERLANDLQEVAVVEQPPRTEGRNMVMVLAPR